MEWLKDNMVMIVVYVIIFVCVFMFINNHKKGLLNKAALYAVSKAEEAWGSKTGRIKFAEVYTYLTKQYPLMTLFFTEKELTEIIETALNEMKEILTTKQGLESKEATSKNK